MNKKISIALAPTGGWGEGNNNPVSPQAIAADVIDCVQSGASILHMHARDVKGKLTWDRACFDETVKLIKEEVDIILEASTGGLSDFSAEQRIVPVTNPFAEMGSLNIGSLNFGDHVYSNSLPDVRYWIEQMTRAGVKPSIEIFDTGHLESALHLLRDGTFLAPCNFSFIFNVQWGMVYDKRLLEYLVSRLPEGSRWGVIFVNSSDFSAHCEAAELGAAILRVGFEDSQQNRGATASTNVELVSALRKELEQCGFQIQRVKETRAHLLD